MRHDRHVTPVDTATLAVALGITPRQVRRLVERGELCPLGVKRTGRRGRPGYRFDLDSLPDDHSA
jgi:hypothetical protein